MSWATDRSIFVVDFYFRKLNTLKCKMREELSAFSRFLQHASLFFANELPSLRQIKRFIAREISIIDNSIANDCDYPCAYELYSNDRRIFYDKVKTLFSKMRATCNYTQNLAGCSPKEVVDSSWFLQEYLHLYSSSPDEKQRIYADLVSLFSTAMSETLASGVLTNDFSTTSLITLKSAVSKRLSSLFEDVSADVSTAISADCNTSSNGNRFTLLRCTELLDNLISFSKQYSSTDEENVVKKHKFDDDLFDYDDYEKISYKKKDDIHFDNVSEPLFEKFCVLPYDYDNEQLDASISPKNLACLNRGGIFTLGDLLLSSPQDLSKIYKFGPCMLDELLSFLNRRFGEPKPNRQKSQSRCRQSVMLRRLHPYTKQMAVSHLQNMANGVADVCEFGADTKNCVQQIFDVLGGDMCNMLIQDNSRAIYLSALVEDALEIEDRKLALKNLFSSLPQETLSYPLQPLIALCDVTHNTRLADIPEYRNLSVVEEIEIAQHIQLRRKAFCDTKFFLEWVKDGAQGISNTILDKLFTKHSARLEIFTCLANGKSHAETAKENDVTCDTVAFIEGQVLRQYAKLPESKELINFASALLNNAKTISKEQFLDIVRIENNLVLFYLAKNAQIDCYTFDCQTQTFCLAHTE